MFWAKATTTMFVSPNIHCSLLNRDSVHAGMHAVWKALTRLEISRNVTQLVVYMLLDLAIFITMGTLTCKRNAAPVFEATVDILAENMLALLFWDKLDCRVFQKLGWRQTTDMFFSCCFFWLNTRPPMHCHSVELFSSMNLQNVDVDWEMSPKPPST